MVTKDKAPERDRPAYETAQRSDSPASGEDTRRRVLNSWKEIAGYLGRGVRTAQRYEREGNLPVHRISESEGASVLAFADELDQWLSRRHIRERCYVRPTLIVVDHPRPGTLSDRKLVLEVAYFNVLTAYSIEEAYTTAERYDVDAFVIDFVSPETDAELCESLKERFPKKPVFVVLEDENATPPPSADHVIPGLGPNKLLAKILDVFGQPKLV